MAWLNSGRRNILWMGGIIILSVLVVLGFAREIAFAGHTPSRTVIPFLDTEWKYKVVSWGAEAGFEASGYSESGFSSGQAGFGTIPPSGGCPVNNSAQVKTTWPVNTDILLRKHFTLAAGDHSLKVEGTIDNDAYVYINGTLIGSVLDGFCRGGGINFTAPDSILVAGDNVLAIRGHDYGGDTFVDVQVSVATVVLNGSFETPNAGTAWQTYSAGQSFGGWTVESGSIDHVGGHWQAAQGSQSVDLTGGEAGAIYQDLPTTGGQAYTLRFALAGNPDCGPTVKQMRVFWGATLVDTVSFDITGRSRASMGWAYHEYRLTAAGALTRLKFVSDSSGFCGPALDDVSVGIAPILDTTPPVVTPQVTGTQGSGGWYRSDVTIAWTVSDPESAITSSAGCNTVILNTDTTGRDYTCTATSSGGATSVTVTVKRDTAAPAATIVTPLGDDVLTSSPAIVQVQASDSLAGVSSVVINGTPATLLSGSPSSGIWQASVPVTLPITLGGALTLSAVAADIAGNTATASPLTLDNDGIASAVDTSPGTFSNDFSDVSVGGTTSGTVNARGGWTITITDLANPTGVQIGASGSGTVATVNACGTEGGVRFTAAGKASVTCLPSQAFPGRPASGSPRLEVMAIEGGVTAIRLTTEAPLAPVSKGKAQATKGKAQSAKAKPATTKSKTNAAKAKPAAAKSKAQTAKAKAKKTTAKTQTAKAKDKKAVAKAQSSKAKAKKTTAKTQTAKAKTQLSTAKSKITPGKTQTAKAKVAAKAKTQTTKAKAQTAKAKPAATKAKSQTTKAKTRVAKSKTQVAKAKPQTTKAKAQLAKAKPQTAKAKTQVAKAKAQTTKAKTTATKAKTPTAKAKTITTKAKVGKRTGITGKAKTKVVKLKPGQKVTTGSPTVADATNVGELAVEVVDADGNVLGTALLTPGAVADIALLDDGDLLVEPLATTGSVGFTTNDGITFSLSQGAALSVLEDGSSLLISTGEGAVSVTANGTPLTLGPDTTVASLADGSVLALNLGTTATSTVTVEGSAIILGPDSGLASLADGDFLAMNLGTSLAAGFTVDGTALTLAPDTAVAELADGDFLAMNLGSSAGAGFTVDGSVVGLGPDSTLATLADGSFLAMSLGTSAGAGFSVDGATLTLGPDSAVADLADGDFLALNLGTATGAGFTVDGVTLALGPESALADSADGDFLAMNLGTAADAGFTVDGTALTLGPDSALASLAAGDLLAMSLGSTPGAGFTVDSITLALGPESALADLADGDFLALNLGTAAGAGFTIDGTAVSLGADSVLTTLADGDFLAMNLGDSAGSGFTVDGTVLALGPNSSLADLADGDFLALNLGTAAGAGFTVDGSTLTLGPDGALVSLADGDFVAMNLGSAASAGFDVDGTTFTLGPDSALAALGDDDLLAMNLGTAPDGGFTVDGVTLTLAPDSVLADLTDGDFIAINLGTAAGAGFTVDGVTLTLGSDSAFAALADGDILAMNIGTASEGGFTVDGVTLTLGPDSVLADLADGDFLAMSLGTATGAGFTVDGVTLTLGPDSVLADLADGDFLAMNLGSSAGAGFTLDGTTLALGVDAVFVVVGEDGDFLVINVSATEASGFTFDDILATLGAGVALDFLPNGSFLGTVLIEGTSASFQLNGAAYDVVPGEALLVDETPPTITGSRAPGPDAAGWNNTDVMVQFSCSDGESGIATCTAPVTLAEGAGQTVTGTAQDVQGNTASDTVSGINIDKTVPSTTATPTPHSNASGWNATNVTVVLSASDPALVTGQAGSGVTTTEYNLDGAGWTPYLSGIPVSGQGVHTLLYRSADVAGNLEAAQSLTVRIDQTPPDASVAGPATLQEGTPGTWTVTAADAGSGVSTIEWDLNGDGDFTDATGHSASRNFADNHPVTVRAKVTDMAGNSTVTSFSTTVLNVAPANVSVSLSAPEINENGSVTLTGSFTDPGVVDGHTIVILWGNGETDTLNLAAGVTTFSASHAYLDDQPSGTPSDVSGISVTVTDKDGESSSASASVTINNLAPTDIALTLSATTITENGSTTVSGSFGDPGTLDTHTVTISWGASEGSTTLSLAAGVLTFSASHQYMDDSPSGTASDKYTISVTVVDDDTGSASSSTSLTVTNLAPVIAGISGPTQDPQPAPYTATITSSFTDVGTLDAHTCTVNWDDPAGTLAAGTVTESGGGGSCIGTHTYTAAGVYTVTVTVADDDTGSATATYATLIVVYDTSAGFVTGGGWIDSPAEACRLTAACQNAVGKANFGFVSRYLPGRTTPSGNTEFTFQAGNFRFKSTSYDWLVVSGHKAQYRGTGTVNGSGSYNFVLTAYDGDLTYPADKAKDAFRIKITDGTGTVVYDNKMGGSDDIDAADPQIIAGGSIVIHK